MKLVVLKNLSRQLDTGYPVVDRLPQVLSRHSDLSKTPAPNRPASAAAGALAGGAAGGIVGALVDAGVPQEEAHVYSEAVRRGRTLLSVRTDEARAEKVRAILGGYEPLDADRLGSDHRSTGWKSFDPDAPSYELSETEIERARRL